MCRADPESPSRPYSIPAGSCNIISAGTHPGSEVLFCVPAVHIYRLTVKECGLSMAATRKVVIVGPQPVQVFDVTVPIEVFSNADGYDVTIRYARPWTYVGNQPAICAHRCCYNQRSRRLD